MGARKALIQSLNLKAVFDPQKFRAFPRVRHKTTGSQLRWHQSINDPPACMHRAGLAPAWAAWGSKRGCGFRCAFCGATLTFLGGLVFGCARWWVRLEVRVTSIPVSVWAAPRRSRAVDAESTGPSSVVRHGGRRDAGMDGGVEEVTGAFRQSRKGKKENAGFRGSSVCGSGRTGEG